MTGPDLRVHALHEGRRVVEPALAEQVPGWTVLSPRAAWATAHLRLQARPEDGAAQVTEALHGEALELLQDLPGGWTWVRTLHDRYLGYLKREPGDLTEHAPQPPVEVTAARTFVFGAPSIRAEVLARAGRGAMFARLAPQPEQHGDYRWWRVATSGGEGYLHAAAIEAVPGDLERFAAASLHTPYLWGGRSAWGLDCSGLAQLWAGKDESGRSRLPRDADQQQAAAMPVTSPGAGDLAFFSGHVGIMLDAERMLHANATHLQVTVETLGQGEYGRQLQAGLLGFGRVLGRP